MQPVVCNSLASNLKGQVMSVYVTGDIHGELQLNRLGHKQWRQGRHLSKKDFLIVLGDFGILWEDKVLPKEERLIKWIDDRKYTVLFVDGNHENFSRLDALPTTQMFGGLVGIVSKSIFHLRRGEIYSLDGKTFFVFGGATSYDKQYRIPGRSWWDREVPSKEEENHALDNLEKAQWKVDYILAHTLPESVVLAMYNIKADRPRDMDPTRRFLDHVVKQTTFDRYYAGHWHDDTSCVINEKKYTIMYETVSFVV